MADEPGTISRELLAKLFKVDERTITRWVSDGWIKKNENGKFTVALAVHGYIDYRDDREKRLNKSAAAVKKDDARTREIELRIAERERNLIAIDTVQNAFDSVWGSLRSEVDGLPARMRRNKALREEIQKLLDGILTRASARIREAMRALRAGGDDLAAVAQDDT